MDGSPEGSQDRKRRDEGARRLAATLLRTADVLEWSARLADAHAAREELNGRPERASQERQAAAGARRAAQRARAQASRPAGGS
jgi:hypothetical protein